MRDVAYDLSLSPPQNRHTFLDSSLPWSVKYFIDRPYISVRICVG